MTVTVTLDIDAAGVPTFSGGGPANTKRGHIWLGNEPCPAEIVFKIGHTTVGRGYTFANNGNNVGDQAIFFSANSNTATKVKFDATFGQFFNPVLSSNLANGDFNVLTVWSLNNDGNPWFYSLNFAPGAPEPSIDPIIVNK